MTEIDYDARLAWDISEWSDLGDGDKDTVLNRGQVKNLAAFLTQKGYTQGKTGGLTSLLSTLEDAGAKLVDEFGPVIDGLRKPR